MQTGGRGSTAGREHFWLQRCLVVLQISISLALVAGALLFVRSFRNLVTLDSGFRPAQLFQARFTVNRTALQRNGAAPYRQPLLDQVRGIPGVEAVAGTTNFLIQDGIWSLIVVAGERVQDARFTWVTPGYFAMIGTPLLAGRDFSGADSANAPKVAVINETFARRFFGDQSPIGRTFRTQPEPDYPAAIYQVVGVIKDTRYYDLREPISAVSYMPAAQYPPGGIWSEMYVRSRLTRETLMAAMRQRISGSQPEITVEIRGFQQTIDDSLARERLLAILSGSFGLLAGLLSAVGLYGLMAYVTARRRNEIGIRLALGASRSRVVGMVFKDVGLLLAGGAVLGLAVSLVLERFAMSLLFGLQPRDPETYAAAVALLAGAAFLGSFLPARHASRLDPMDALRTG